MKKIEPMIDSIRTLNQKGFSEKALSFLNKIENLGTITNANQITEMTGPCGDKMTISLLIDNNMIQEVKMEVMGCTGTQVSASALADLARGKTLTEAEKIDLEILMKELERVPDQKAHCARLAVKVLHKALDQYHRDKDS